MINGFIRMIWMRRFLLLLLLLLNNNNEKSVFVTGLEDDDDDETNNNNNATTILGTFDILDSVPHDILAFTQGLELADRDENSNSNYYYYESTGKYDKSTIRIVNLLDGVVIYQHKLSSEYWGEGLTYLPTKNQLLQLTWKSGIGFIYEASTLASIGEFPINTTSNEGWGICYANTDDSSVLYVSDGTNYLHTWNAHTFELLSKIRIERRLPLATTITPTSDIYVTNINELEYDIHSQTVLANVWKSNYILRINPKTGFVTHQYDITELVDYTAILPDHDGLHDDDAAHVGVLNGIAMTNEPNIVWVTGKYWNRMYRIRLRFPGDEVEDDNNNNKNDEKSGGTTMHQGSFITKNINNYYWMIALLLFIVCCY